MFRLVAVTLAALFLVLYLFGDRARTTPEVARAESPALALTGFTTLTEAAAESLVVPASGLSKAEAVRQALAAAERIRAERPGKRRSLRLIRARAKASAAVAEPAPADHWYVTGSRVNLRAGPGTTNPVVRVVTRGTPAEVLEDHGNWRRIRLTDGGSGWIHGKFLGERQPG